MFKTEYAVDKIWELSSIGNNIKHVIYYDNSEHESAFRKDLYRYYKEIIPLHAKHLEHNSIAQFVGCLFLLATPTLDQLRKVIRGSKERVNFIVARHHIAFSTWVYRGSVQIPNSFNLPSLFAIYENPKAVEVHLEQANSKRVFNVFGENVVNLREKVARQTQAWPSRLRSTLERNSQLRRNNTRISLPRQLE